MTKKSRSATPEEVQSAATHLTGTDKARLKLYANRRLRAIGRFAAGNTAEDVIQEALLRALRGEGKRAWPIETVSFIDYMLGSIRSITSHLVGRYKSVKHEEPGLESTLTKVNPDGEEYNPMDNATRSLLDTGSLLDGKCDPNEAEEMLAKMFKHFENDDQASDMLVHILDGLKGPEIQAKMNLSEKEFATVHRRIMRNLPNVMHGGRA